MSEVGKTRNHGVQWGTVGILTDSSRRSQHLGEGDQTMVRVGTNQQCFLLIVLLRVWTRGSWIDCQLPMHQQSCWLETQTQQASR